LAQSYWGTPLISRVEESSPPPGFVESCEIFFWIGDVEVSGAQLASAPGGFNNRKDGSEIVLGSFAYTAQRDA